jgi:hypothetical protein
MGTLFRSVCFEHSSNLTLVTSLLICLWDWCFDMSVENSIKISLCEHSSNLTLANSLSICMWDWCSNMSVENCLKIFSNQSVGTLFQLDSTLVNSLSICLWEWCSDMSVENSIKIYLWEHFSDESVRMFFQSVCGNTFQCGFVWQYCPYLYLRVLF